jgi:hypothetical protein
VHTLNRLVHRLLVVTLLVLLALLVKDTTAWSSGVAATSRSAISNPPSTGRAPLAINWILSYPSVNVVSISPSAAASGTDPSTSSTYAVKPIRASLDPAPGSVKISAAAT